MTFRSYTKDDKIAHVEEMKAKWGMEDNRANESFDRTSKFLLSLVHNTRDRLSPAAQKYFRELETYMNRFATGDIKSKREYYK